MKNKLGLFCLASMGYLILLLIIYMMHVRFFRVDVVLYSAIFDALLATALAGILLGVLKVFKTFSRFEKIQTIFVWLLLGYIFAISVPTVIDRSLSFYILEKLQQRGGGIKLNAFEDVFVKEYMPEHRLVDVRITEQQQSGTIQVKNGCVLLTERGQTLATFSRFFRNHLLPKQRLLMGEYSSDLTDPFRNSSKHPDYLCQG
jgi:hypothetical protein